MENFILEIIDKYGGLIFAALGFIFAAVSLLELREHLEFRSDMKAKSERLEERIAVVIEPDSLPEITTADVVRAGAELAGDIAGIPIQFGGGDKTVKTVVEYTCDMKRYRGTIFRRQSLFMKHYSEGDEITVCVDPEYPEIPLSTERAKSMRSDDLRSCILYGCGAAVFFLTAFFMELIHI